ncbi:MAG: hypothetical protein Q9184_004252 [Pyrenodesmia sp. 2 TL-2023]
MRCTTILLAAFGLECALAQPANHRHHHKQRRAENLNTVKYDLSGVDFKTLKLDLSGVDFKTVKYGVPTPTTTAAGQATSVVNSVQPSETVNVDPLPAQGAKADTESSNPGTKSQDTTSGAGIVKNAQGGAQGSFGGRTTPVVTGDRITYIGNVGNPYGSNMMFVPSVDGYKYTNTFKNVGQNPIPINVWNKAGRDGRANSGGCTEPNLKFTLAAGESQVVAFDENTQAAFSRDCEKGAGGYPACVWGELDYGDLRPSDATGQGNAGHSGFDRSSIPGGHGEMLTMTCVDCAGGEQTSSREINRFTDASQLSGGGQVNPGPAHFLTEMAI